jgi:hypothetical protein
VADLRSREGTHVMANCCLNRLHVLGAPDKVERFVIQAPVRHQGYAPAHTLELRLIEEIEQGADPIEADRKLAGWLDSIGAGPASWVARIMETRVLPVDIAQPDLSEAERQVRLAAWSERVRAEAGRTLACDKPEENGWLSLHALRPVPEEVLDAGYPDAGRYWQSENWGTRTDTFDVPRPTMEPRPSGQQCAVYFFETAWAPPLEALHAGSRRYPDLLFVVSYAEPGMDFYGGAAFSKGERYEPEDCSASELHQKYSFVDPTLSILDWVEEYLRYEAEEIEGIGWYK